MSGSLAWARGSRGRRTCSSPPLTVYQTCRHGRLRRRAWDAAGAAASAAQAQQLSRPK